MKKSLQQGFTLVELAIALMIIGLLIGAVLKGQELVQNARDTQWVRQLASYRTATAAFQLQYNALPGDFLRATTRLRNCSSPCANGNNNKQITNYYSPPGASRTPSYYAYGLGDAYPTGENRNFWIHLAKADLITGVNADYTGTYSATPGVEVPAGVAEGSSVGIEHYSGTPTWGSTSFTSDNYLVIFHVTTGQPAIYPRTAAFIDAKLDDGLALTGDVRPIGIQGINGGAPVSPCIDGSNQYGVLSKEIACYLQVRIK